MTKNVKTAHDQLYFIGELVTKFARVTRAPRMPDGARETDAEHSFHLGLTATELAGTYFPNLNAGLVAQFSLVHDLPEVYAGDVWTFGLSKEALKTKADLEGVATERLLKELPPYTAKLLERYEKQNEEEAIFVRFVDKFLPAIINYWAGPASTFLEDYKVSSREELREMVKAWDASLKQRFPGYPFLYELLEMIEVTSDEETFRHHKEK